ncbi:MAG: FAD-dependent oxidoreductase [Pseudomonadota bacterium]
MNGERSIECDLCVIGAGSAGLSVTAGAAQLGVKTVLVERGEMGGDCLNVGCVPSKALIAAGRRAHDMRHTAQFGISPVEPEIDFAATLGHVSGVIETIAPVDSQERFEGLGATVIREHGEFIDGQTLQAGSWRIRARRFIIATGSRPAVPPIPGLEDVPYLTNETLWADRGKPEHLIIIGGGPIGVEMAQAHRRLGSKVTIIEMARLLARDDEDLANVVRDRLVAEGVNAQEGAAVKAVKKSRDGSIAVEVETDGRREGVVGDQLLVATGRQVITDGLGLEKAGVAFDRRGITVDRGLRTSNRRIYAIGDASGDMQFTHVAGYHAALIIRNALFRLPIKKDQAAIPRVTYSEPELATVGLIEAEAREQYGDSVTVLKSEFAHNDRAIAERETEGLIKVIVGGRGKILGAGIVGRQAGELINPWVLAMSQNIKIAAMASMVAPYPTLAEINKRAAGTFFAPKLFSDRTRSIVRLLTKLG